MTSLTADSRQTALCWEWKGNSHQMAPATAEERHRRDNWQVRCFPPIRKKLVTSLNLLLYFFPFGRAIFLCTHLLFAQRVLVLLLTKCTLGNFPGCGKWDVNSRWVVNCKETLQISRHLLPLIAKDTQASPVIHHSVLCYIWPLPCCKSSLSTRPAELVLSVSPAHFFTEVGLYRPDNLYP